MLRCSYFINSWTIYLYHIVTAKMFVWMYFNYYTLVKEQTKLFNIAYIK